MRPWRGDTGTLRRLTAPLLLIGAVLAVYYPALSGGLHPVDDGGIVSLYSAAPPLSQVLRPGNGYYYRPLTELFFWLDNRLWGMAPQVMHLENILLHCLNSLLVFLLARPMAGCTGPGQRRFPVLPLLAALLFALHPVNVEAVAWIAGRTDPLMTLFLLAALRFWLRWFEVPAPRDLLAALLLTAAALLVKETAFAFAGVVLLLAWGWPGTAGLRQRFLAVMLPALAAGGLLAVALLFRSGVGGLSRLLGGLDISLTETPVRLLSALGFYCRKLLVPVPLNFAVDGLQPLDMLPGLALAPLLWLLLRRNRRGGILWAAAAVMVTPVLPLVLKQIAWTPVAERYLYCSTALFALGLVPLITAAGERLQRLGVALLTVVICCWAAVSLPRVLLWQDTYGFFRDALAKSPGFGTLHNELGAILLQRGDLDGATAAFTEADRLNRRESMRLPIKANLMGVEYVRGNDAGVRRMFFQLFRSKEEAPAMFLELLYRADSRQLERLAGDARQRQTRDLLETLELLYRKRPDPFWLYQEGRLALAAGDRDRARDRFRRAHDLAPADAHYRGAAELLLRRVESGDGGRNAGIR